MASREDNVENLILTLASDHFEVESALAIAFAIRDDNLIRTKLRSLCGADVKEPFQIGQMRGQVWMRVTDEGVTAHRQLEPDIPMVRLDQAIASSSELLTLFHQGGKRSAALEKASTLLNPFFQKNAIPLRAHFEAIQPWLALIEQPSYKYGARVIELLDALRPHMKPNLAAKATGSDNSPSLYWSSVNALAQCVMLASSEEARPWLVDMADQLAWKTWTPSFPLIRERTIWHATCAARSANSFGEGVVGKYLSVLSSARSPMVAFDALFGACAIASNRTDIRSELRSEVTRLRRVLERRRPPYFEYYDLIYADALRVLSGQPSDEADIILLAWDRLSELGLATSQALRADPASITAAGRYLGFSLLPIMCSTQPADTYPRTGHDVLAPSFGEMVEILCRAWVPDHPNLATVH